MLITIFSSRGSSWVQSFVETCWCYQFSCQVELVRGLLYRSILP